MSIATEGTGEKEGGGWNDRLYRKKELRCRNSFFKSVNQVVAVAEDFFRCLLGTMSGDFVEMLSLVITHLEIFSLSGISYMISNIMSSKMLLNPRDPVFWLIAVLAISLNELSSKTSLTPSFLKSS